MEHIFIQAGISQPTILQEELTQVRSLVYFYRKSPVLEFPFDNAAGLKDLQL